MRRSVNQLQISTRAARGGFTVLELCFGIIVTSLVMLAVASFSLAMGTAWRRSSELESLTLRARQAGARVAREIRDGKLITTFRAGSLDGSAPAAGVMIWKEDTNGDGKIQGAELELIEHNTGAHQLTIYRAGQGNNTIVLAWAAVSDPAVISNFKIGRTGVPLARGVYGALFNASATTSTTQQPTLEYALKLVYEPPTSSVVETSTTGSYTEYGTAAVRAPLPKPS